MNIRQNVDLSKYNTFKTGGKAKYFCEVKDESELIEAIKFARDSNLKYFVIGNGSNLLISDEDFPGFVIKMAIKGIILENRGLSFSRHPVPPQGKTSVLEHGNYSVVSSLSGESIDDIITFTIKNNLSGIENLWNIPGTVGASAVQNIGAYGVEIKDFIIAVEGVNIDNLQKFIFNNENCNFRYRDSIFKKNKNLIITKVIIKLNNKFFPNFEYSALREYFSGKKSPNITEVINAIGEIRKNKLPDWKVLGTAGSFFKNPIITKAKYAELLVKYPNLPMYEAEIGFVKIPLGYVIDKVCGLKGFKIGSVGLYDKQSLIVVNYGGATFFEIDSFAKIVEEKVFEKINIKIEREVENIF